MSSSACDSPQKIKLHNQKTKGPGFSKGELQQLLHECN